jgi:hypothetical protein
MGWATPFIAKLKTSETAQFRPRGKIESGQLCMVAPLTGADELRLGDTVLCKVNGREYLHLIKAIQGPRFQIGNNRGRINGWIGINALFGKCIEIES